VILFFVYKPADQIEDYQEKATYRQVACHTIFQQHSPRPAIFLFSWTSFRWSAEIRGPLNTH